MAKPTPPDNPLSYPSLKHVLQYMEANHRYALVARCPSLRLAHRKTPLIVKYLKLDRTELTLNDFRHKFVFSSDREHEYLPNGDDLQEGDIRIEAPREEVAAVVVPGRARIRVIDIDDDDDDMEDDPPIVIPILRDHFVGVNEILEVEVGNHHAVQDEHEFNDPDLDFPRVVQLEYIELDDDADDLLVPMVLEPYPTPIQMPDAPRPGNIHRPEDLIEAEDNALIQQVRLETPRQEVAAMVAPDPNQIRNGRPAIRRLNSSEQLVARPQNEPIVPDGADDAAAGGGVNPDLSDPPPMEFDGPDLNPIQLPVAPRRIIRGRQVRNQNVAEDNAVLHQARRPTPRVLNTQIEGESNRPQGKPRRQPICVKRKIQETTWKPDPDPFLKFIMTNKLPETDKEENFVRLSVITKIRDAIRRHLGHLLSQHTLVKHLEVTMEKGILRIPRSLKFRICDLTALSQAFLPIQTILNVRTSPFNKLTLTIAKGHDHLLHDPIIRSFPKLHLKLTDPPEIMDRVYSNLPHQEVYVFGIKANIEEICALAEAWMARNRPTGSRFLMAIKSVYESNWIERCYLKRILETLNAQWKKFNRSTKCVCLSMRDNKELVIYAQQQELSAAEYARNHRQLSSSISGPWALVLEVMELGHTEELVVNEK